MRRRPPPEDEYFDDVDADEAPTAPLPPAAPVPREAPAFLWLAPSAPGAVLPDPEPIAGGDVRCTVTPAWRRRWLAGVIGHAALELAIFVGIAFILNAGDLAAVPLVMWAMGLGFALLALVTGLRRPRPIALLLTADGITFEHSSYHLMANWDQVVRVVQLGADQAKLALRLEGSAAVWERPTSARPWRRIPYPWDTTVPLEPFTMGDASNHVQRWVAGALPALRGVPSSVEAPHAETPSRRAAGFAIGLLPLVALIVAFSLFLRDSPATLVLRALIICGLGAMSLAGWNGTTGERTADFVARVVLGGSNQPRRAAVPVLARVYASYVVFIALGFTLSMASTSADGLAAKYGPAHTCWTNQTGKITGCALRGGAMLGVTGVTEVTCFFAEPLPAGTLTFHCSK